jgi:hypothetical protein
LNRRCGKDRAAVHFEGVRDAMSLSPKVTKNFGMLLLSAWLILSGLVPLMHLSFSGLDLLMAILAIAAGALILVNR